MAHLEPVIAAVAAFLLGFLWYTALFGKAWQKETGITDEQAGQGIAVTHGLAFLMMCVIAYSINIVIGFHAPEEQTLSKSLKLFLIDGSYIAIFCAVMGAVMGALKWA